MPFANVDEKKVTKSFGTFRKLEYIELGEGQHLVRIIENPAKKFYVHFVGFTYIQCLGDECPICENNKKLMFEHSKDFRTQKDWKPRTERFYVNVLDKTRVKICGNCSAEVKNLNVTACPKCNSMLTGEVQPLNKIKVLAKGKTVFDDFNILSSTIHTDNGDEVDITNYDWMLIVRGAGKDTTTTISPRYAPGLEAPENLGDKELFDLENSVALLTREEMIDVLGGAQLKEVFAMRRATKEAAKAVALNAGDPVLMNDIQTSIANLFKE
jgi:hypothetical protein